MHTEEQAKTKWCPETRALQYQGSGSVNRRTDSPCIASGCMHWRWLKASQHPSGLGYLGDGTPSDDRAQGYCGLSGSPR